MATGEPDWRQFEIAVATFMAAIGPGAKVTHDAKIPDIHTGHLRQRDVWIEWSIGNHFPAKALVSCKHSSKKLDQKDIDHFNGEFISSGAQIGIIYSKSGFNDHAIQKSRQLRFHCCKLYEDEPADLPESLSFGPAYNFRPAFQVSVNGDAAPFGFKTWREVLNLPFESRTVLDAFADSIEAHQSIEGMRDARWARARNGSRFVVRIDQTGMPELGLVLKVIDRAYRAKIELTMLNGSYNITADSFLGSQSGPWIDTQSVHPGSGWEEITEIPEAMPVPMLAIFMGVNSRENLIRFSELPFPGSVGSA